MCRVLPVSRSGFYRWLKHSPSRRQKDNEQLLAHIRQIHAESNRNYGSPKVTDALRQRGINFNHKRI